MPKVSIIIPVYKVEKYLPDCLNSVLSQTFQDWEVICVNDGSPDNCGKILAKYAKKDKRIKVITQENQGGSVARNHGLKQAKGEYICFLDGDNALAPTFLEKMYTQLDARKAHPDIWEEVCKNAPHTVRMKLFDFIPFGRFIQIGNQRKGILKYLPFITTKMKLEKK